MPELPEVEVLRGHLAGCLPGRRVKAVEVFHQRPIRPHRPLQLQQALVGADLESVERRAKYLLIGFRQASDARRTLLVHLGMTGRLHLAEASAEISRHTVVTLDLGDARLMFEDARRFGRFTLDIHALDGLGPEPLEAGFSVEGLAEKLGGSRSPIKNRLLDQSVVAGLGNIYACEALYRAGISPSARSDRLGIAAVIRLHGAIREVLGEAIDAGRRVALDFGAGSDGLFYFGSAGTREIQERPGAGVDRFRVYDRAGRECLRCGGLIRRKILAGRGTYFCGGCQGGDGAA